MMLVGLISLLTQSAAPPSDAEDPSEYDGRVTFARLRYNMANNLSEFGRGGFNSEGQPPWAHDYPRAERNLMHILAHLSGADVELNIDLRLFLPLIHGWRIGVLEGKILHILRNQANLRHVVRAIGQGFRSFDSAFLFRHFRSFVMILNAASPQGRPCEPRD